MKETLIGFLIVSALVFSTVWFAAQASQHNADMHRAQARLANVSQQLSQAESSLVATQTRSLARAQTVSACQNAITHSLHAMDLATEASIMETKGGAAKVIAASSLLTTAIQSFRQGLPDVHACRAPK